MAQSLPNIQITVKHWDRIKEPPESATFRPISSLSSSRSRPSTGANGPHGSRDSRSPGLAFRRPGPRPRSHRRRREHEVQEPKNSSPRSSPILAVSPIPSTARVDLSRSDKQMHIPHSEHQPNGIQVPPASLTPNGLACFHEHARTHSPGRSCGNPAGSIGRYTVRPTGLCCRSGRRPPQPRQDRLSRILRIAFARFRPEPLLLRSSGNLLAGPFRESTVRPRLPQMRATH